MWRRGGEYGRHFVSPATEIKGKPATDFGGHRAGLHLCSPGNGRDVLKGISPVLSSHSALLELPEGARLLIGTALL